MAVDARKLDEDRRDRLGDDGRSKVDPITPITANAWPIPGYGGVGAAHGIKVEKK